ncbi:aminodeoxychorismate lyase [Colwelliaceae bacterium MEBiC 14330]
MKYCSINGIEKQVNNITDRGLAYGDGLFTTAKILHGKVILIDKHLERLTQGCKHLGIELSSEQHLKEQICAAVKPFKLATLKVIITAGSGGRGYSRAGLSINDTNIIIMVFDFPSHYKLQSKQGISLGDSTQQIGSSSMLLGIKHLNRLEQVLLRTELDKRQEDELLVTNHQGEVIEATSANVFFWLEGQLCTPEISTSGVNGIIRQYILANKPDIKICRPRLKDLQHVQAMFICNSLMGIMPVRTYNGRKLNIEQVIALQTYLNDVI